MSSRLYEILAQHLSNRKRLLFDKVAANRTRHLTLVLEDIYQAQNTSAIQRSAESWGLQDLYIIENNHPFMQHKRIAKGANEWLNVHRFNADADNTNACIRHLKSKGYQIAITALDDGAIPIQELNIATPTAIFLGTELTGVSSSAWKHADVIIKVPTYGFTASLNVGSAAAVILHYLVEQMRKSNIQWRLSDGEQLDLKIQWAKKSIYWSDYLIEMHEAGEI